MIKFQSYFLFLFFFFSLSVYVLTPSREFDKYQKKIFITGMKYYFIQNVTKNIK